ncbi:Mitochondrial import inner membrane translocase subunit tim44 [Penicillium argentinense]|uniref:Mitochondrial import inner membrane translocase subunit TIM44 n=1 Tax=Penicillium argentinense TaxID=1131581 RepID=A0A9W9KAG1_9EURO|nr:Mitochondrial import inner membrane translocase subunit tim44 [Penicillium argentinense]KAJ5098985.1 Mitochondrial import inner membrane translocase subunit tim44 [Penicillium argentinense]
MSAAARAATLRSQVPALKAGSRAVSYSALPAQALKLSAQSQTSILRASRSPAPIVSPFAAVLLTRSFHVATPLFQQQQQQQSPKDEKKQGEESKSESEGGESKEDGKEKKEDAPPPPPHGDKSPWQVFRETLQTEFKASKEWNESTKALASSAHEFSENENIKRARAAYQAASGAAGTRTSAALKSTGQVIGKSAAWTWNTTAVKGIRKGVNATGEGLEKATRPVRQTEAYKSVKDAIDDGSSSRYGGWVEKEERRKQRQLREEMELKSGKRRTEQAVEDPNAGTNVTLHKDSAWKESWRDFKDSNPMMQKLFGLRDVYEESENPLISTARSITDRIGGFFAENETAMVIKRFREIDPNFKMEEFQRELREYMLPEVLDAYVKGDIETLKMWLSDAQFSVYAALAKQYTTAGLKSDGRILDVRGVDISHARLLDPGEIPVFVVTCRAQEIHVYKNVKTGKLAAGMEDKVQLVTYAIGMTRIPEEVNNPETRGWRLIELQKAARDYI